MAIKANYGRDGKIVKSQTQAPHGCLSPQYSGSVDDWGHLSDMLGKSHSC